MTQKTIDATANKELIDACQKGDTEKVRSRLQNGASPNTLETLWGWSVLNRAVDSGYKDIVNMLLEYGAECAEKDINWARRRDWPEIAVLLDRHIREREKNRQDHSVLVSSKGSQPSAVSQIKGVSTKERTVGEIFGVSIVLFLIGILLSQATEMPVGVMIIGAVALAFLGNIIIFLVDRRRPERPGQPSATHKDAPTPETKEPDPVRINIETPKALLPNTPDRVASDGSVHRPVPHRSAFAPPSRNKDSSQQARRPAHKVTATRSPALKPALRSRSVRPRRKRPTDTEWAAASRALSHHSLPAKILANPMAEGYSRMLDGLSQRYPLIPFDFPPMEEQIHEFAATGEYLSGQGSLPDYKTLMPRQILRGFLSDVRDQALCFYSTHRPDFSFHSVIPEGVGSTSFWQDEAYFRETEAADALPLDWRERRLVVYYRDEGHCRYCGRGVRDRDFHAHHIRGKSMTGDHGLDNLVTLCTSCHSVMPGHTADLKKRDRSSKGKRRFAARLRQTEMGEWTKDLVNKTVTSLAAKYSLPAATRKKSHR